MLILIVNTEIACAQPSTQSDTTGIFYTDKQDINCLRCLIAEPIKDSILIETRRHLVKMESLFNFEIDKLNSDIDKANKSLSKEAKRKKRWRIISFSAIGVAIVEGVILLIK